VTFPCHRREDTKGKGVSLFENKEGWHGKPVPKRISRRFSRNCRNRSLRRFSSETSAGSSGANGRAPDRNNSESKAWRLVATREAYGDALVKIADKSSRVVALDGDTKNPTFSEKLQSHRSNFLKCSSQNRIWSVCAGLSARGKIPFSHICGISDVRTTRFEWPPCRGKHQVLRVSWGIHRRGRPSQMGLEDIAMFRPIPGSIVLYPCDAVSAENWLPRRHAGLASAHSNDASENCGDLFKRRIFVIGGSKVVRKTATTATVIAAGITLHEALSSAKALEGEGLFFG
jgi:transketolase